MAHMSKKNKKTTTFWFVTKLICSKNFCHVNLYTKDNGFHWLCLITCKVFETSLKSLWMFSFRNYDLSTSSQTYAWLHSWIYKSVTFMQLLVNTTQCPYALIKTTYFFQFLSKFFKLFTHWEQKPVNAAFWTSTFA